MPGSTAQKLDLDLGTDTSPLQVAVGDINRDGHFGMYVSGYIRKELVEGQNIFNKEGYRGTSRLFYPGWALVFLIVVLGTGSELAIGDVCPRSDSGMPLCYFSLALCLAIMLFYWFTSRSGAGGKPFPAK